MRKYYSKRYLYKQIEVCLRVSLPNWAICVELDLNPVGVFKKHFSIRLALLFIHIHIEKYFGNVQELFNTENE